MDSTIKHQIITGVTLIAVLGPWRAFLIMFVSSPVFMLKPVFGQLSNNFISQAACEEFISDIDLSGEVIELEIGGKKYKAKVVGFEFFCNESIEGQGI